MGLHGGLITRRSWHGEAKQSPHPPKGNQDASVVLDLKVQEEVSYRLYTQRQDPDINLMQFCKPHGGAVKRFLFLGVARAWTCSRWQVRAIDLGLKLSPLAVSCFSPPKTT